MVHCVYFLQYFDHSSKCKFLFPFLGIGNGTIQLALDLSGLLDCYSIGYCVDHALDVIS